MKRNRSGNAKRGSVSADRSFLMALAKLLPSKANLERIALVYRHLDFVDDDNGGFIVAKSYKDWASYAFPWLTPRQVKEAFVTLERLGAIELIAKPGDVSGVVMLDWYPDGERHPHPDDERQVPRRSTATTQTMIVLPPDDERQGTPIILKDLIKTNKDSSKGDGSNDPAATLADLHVSLCEDSGLVVTNPRAPATLAAAIRSMPPDALADLEQALQWAKTERWWITQLCRQAGWTAKGGARYVELVNQYRAKGMQSNSYQRRQSAYTPGHLIESPVYDEFKQVQMI